MEPFGVVATHGCGLCKLHLQLVESGRNLLKIGSA